MRVERRQRVRREDRAVVDQVDRRVVDVEPVGDLPGGDEVDPAYPRREEVDAAQRVAELVAGHEPGLPARLAGLRGLGRVGAAERGEPLLAGPVPHRVVAVDPGVDDVDGERALVDGRLGHQREGADGDALDLVLDRLDAARDALGVGVEPRRHQLPVDVGLPELDLDRAAAGRPRAAGRPGPAATARARRTGVRPRWSSRASSDDDAAALVPAGVGGVAQGEVRRQVGVGERLEEPVAGVGGHHDDGRLALVRRDHQPLVAGGPGAVHQRPRGRGAGRGPGSGGPARSSARC